jgi:hypothetical protein
MQWSPDGATIAATSTNLSSQVSGGVHDFVFIIDVKTGNVKQLPVAEAVRIKKQKTKK